jgi:hypothetical protein
MRIVDDRARGWFHIDNAVIDEYLPQIGVTAFAVYACIVRHSDVHGNAFPSYSKFQSELGCGRSQVAAAVKAIVDAGLVTITTGKRASNCYHIVTVSTSPKSELVPIQNQSRSETGTSPGARPELVPNRDCNNTQLTRPKEQDPKAAVAAGEPARIRTRPHARGTRDGADDGVAIPADLSPGDEERSQMVTLAIPQQWYFTKWWSIVEHYENKPEDKRTIEKWRWTCRHLISEDWAKELARTQTRSR